VGDKSEEHELASVAGSSLRTSIGAEIDATRGGDLTSAMQLLDAVTTPVLLVRADRILAANQAAVALLGAYDQSPLGGSSLSGLLAGRAWDQESRAKVLSWLFEGKAGRASPAVEIPLRLGAEVETVAITRRAVLPDQDAPLVITIQRLAPADAAPAGVVDPSETIRLTSVGDLASAAAQAVNNPLAFVASNLTYATERLKYISALLDDSSSMQVSEPRTLRGLLLPVLEALAEAHLGADRATRLIKDLRSLFERDSAFEPVDVQTAVEAALNMAEAEVSRQARLRAELGARGSVLGNTTRLTQLFLSLIVQRAQALPAGNANGYRIDVKSWIDGDFALVSVGDNQNALSQGDSAGESPGATRASEIPAGIAELLVSSLQGSLQRAEVPGRGMVVTVRLPLTDSSQKRTPPSLSPIRPGRRTRVLIVDNEPLIVRALSRLLRGDYDVETAGGGHEALDLIVHAGPFDLVLCDLGMPEMSGLDLFREVVQRTPEMGPRFVFVTGGTASDEARSVLAGLSNHLLEKPVQPERLREVMAELIGTRAAPTAAK